MTRYRSVTFIAGMLFLSCLALTVIPVSASSSTVHVGGSGAGNYTTIHDAIDNVSAGGLVIIYPGEFHETLVLEKSVELRGSGQNTTIINGSRTGNVITIASDNVSIQDLTVTGSQLVFPRAGIMVKANGSRVTNVTSTDNFYGAILWWGTHSAVFEGDSIYANHRCGIYFSHSSGNRINWNRFLDNPFNGCGLYEGSNGNVIAGNLFARNGFCGVNIRDSSQNHISGNLFENNTIAVHVAPPPFMTTLMDNSFQGNGQDIQEEMNPSVVVGLAFTAVVLLGVLWFWRRL